MSRSPLVVEADDLGLSRELNQGIREAATRGVLTSACVRLNGAALDEAVHEVVPECPALGIGIHLNIVEGTSGRPRIARSSPLCSPDGRYRMSFPGLLRMQRSRALLDEIELDYRNQIENGLKHFPDADHLNSHQHSHAVPSLFELVCRLSLEYGIPFVRLPRERFYTSGRPLRHLRAWYAVNLVKVGILNGLAPSNERTARRLGVATNQWLVGIGYTGYMTVETLLAGVQPRTGNPPDGSDGIVEVLLHPARVQGVEPGAYPHDGVRRWIRSAARERELETLLDPSLPVRLDRAGWEPTTYGRVQRRLTGERGPAVSRP